MYLHCLERQASAFLPEICYLAYGSAVADDVQRHHHLNLGNSLSGASMGEHHMRCGDAKVSYSTWRKRVEQCMTIEAGLLLSLTHPEHPGRGELNRMLRKSFVLYEK
eukprot:6194850-Pleurochrysis_carterae.AAC.1